MTIEQKITKARMTMLMSGKAFFASVALHLRVVVDDSVETACTDGAEIIFNPHFVESLTLKQLMFLICHEVMHVAMKHCFRLGSRDPKVFNIAADHQINLALIEEGFGDFIKDGVADKRFSGMSVERIYNLLLAEQANDQSDGSDDQSGDSDEQSGGPSGGGQSYGPDDVPSFDDAVANGSIGQVKNGPDDGGVTAEAIESAVTIASLAAKSQGDLSADTLRALAGRNESVVDWQDRLDDILANTGNDTVQCWSRKHRNFRDYLPGYRREGFEWLVIGCDTSGSMSESELRRSVSETMAIADKYGPRLTFIPCDSRINPNHVQEFDCGEYPESAEGFRLSGGGGTDPQPVFDWVCDGYESPDALVFFTDGYVNSWPEEPEYPVVWVLTTNGPRPPYGIVVEAY